MTNHSHRHGVSPKTGRYRTKRSLLDSLTRFRRIIEIAREQRRKSAGGRILRGAENSEELKRGLSWPRSSLVLFRSFLSEREDFPQLEPQSKVYTLGGNYSVLPIHPEDFTSSDGKITLGATSARRQPNLEMGDNFDEFSATRKPSQSLLTLEYSNGFVVPRKTSGFGCTEFQISITPDLSILLPKAAEKTGLVFCDSLNTFLLH